MEVFNKSQNEKYFITGGSDGTAVVWHSSGQLKSVLRGLSAPLTFVCFINDKTLITADKEGNVVIWKMDEPQLLKDEMIGISPFDYNSKLKLESEKELSFNEIYNLDKDSEFEEVMEKLLGYSYGIPKFNDYVSDKKHTNIINNSIKELKDLYDSIADLEKFSAKTVTIKRQFLDNRIVLLEKEVQLKHQEISNDNQIVDLKKRQIETEKLKTNYLSEKYSVQKEKLLLDTVEIDEAVRLAENLRRDFVKTHDTIQDYENITLHLEKAIDLMSTFQNKHGKHGKHDNDNAITSELGNLYGTISYYYLFTNNYRKAIEMANKSIQLDSVRNDWVLTNKALGYLLSGEFSKAEKIYKDYNGKYTHDGMYFNSGFLEDFKDLEKAGIINDDKKIENVKKIKKILNPN